MVLFQALSVRNWYSRKTIGWISFFHTCNQTNPNDPSCSSSALARLGYTRNRCEHDKRTRIELKRLTHCTHRRLNRKVALEDFVELLDFVHIEQVELYKHHVLVVAAGLV